MTTLRTLYALLFLLTLSGTGCQAVADIFKAGMWVGLIVAVIIVGLVIMLLRRLA